MIQLREENQNQYLCIKCYITISFTNGFSNQVLSIWEKQKHTLKNNKPEIFDSQICCQNCFELLMEDHEEGHHMEDNVPLYKNPSEAVNTKKPNIIIKKKNL